MLTPVLPAGSGADLTEVAPTIAQASGKSRRDIAVVPLLVIGGGALGLLVATLLRPAETDGGAARPITLGIAAAALLLCLAWIPARPLLRNARSRTIFRAYTAAATALLLALIVIAIADAGLSSVEVGAAVLVAANTGLAFPKRWSRDTIIAIVAGLAAVHALRPEAGTMQAISVLGLVVAAWAVGLILRRGHRGASRDALLLSRGDQLTGGLNRRGFIENVAYDLARAARRGEPLLLLVIGLRDGLGAALDGRPVDREGALADVAGTLAGELPAGAALGRIGAAKLGVVIPGGRSVDADWFAGAAREALSGRVTVFVGAASSPDGTAPLAELFDVAEACLLEARRRSPEGAQLSEVRRAEDPGAARSTTPARRPAVTYERLRGAGGPPASVEPWGMDGQWLFGGMCTVALAGALFLVVAAIEGHSGLAASAVTYGGLPWIVTALCVGFAYRRHPRSAGHPPLFPVVAATALVAIGAVVAALSTGQGVLSPVIGALYLKVFFDASTFDGRLARVLASSAGLAWLVVLVLGPAETLWVAPFQAAVLLGAFALGTLGHNAYDAATSGRLDLARTDPFTGLVDRGGFYEHGEALLALGDPAGRSTFGVILIDVEPLSPRAAKAPATGPRRTAAGIVAQHLRDASVVARFGSGDFRAIVRVETRSELETLLDRLREEVAAASSACRIGGALYGPDGVTLDALLAIASHRAAQDERLASAA